MDITVDSRRIVVRDPARPRDLVIPRRAITSVDAAVAERWVANVLIGPRSARALVPPPFLEPLPAPGGQHVLSLCAIFMRHAAPSWAPLALGPGSHNCALRLACVDRRDGSAAVWVDHRYTDSPLAAVLDLLGFPPVHPRLRLDREGEGLATRRLRLVTRDDQLELDLRRGRHPAPLAFTDATDFDGYFTAGIRSYGPGPRLGC